MGTALCHEWVTTFGGAEQVSRRIADTLGIEDIFTFAADPALARNIFPGQTVHVASMGRTALARRHWQWMLPIIPYAWSRLDLSMYRVVITSSHACTNAIRVPAGSYHISYCHSPMRYAWDWPLEIRRFPPPVRLAWPTAAALLRAADRRWARRVTLFIANSRNVAGRIRRYYDRCSVVVHPPIDTAFWTPGASDVRGNFFLYAGRLVAYKRPDVAVEAAGLAGVRLVIAGSGPEMKRLERQSGADIEFVRDPSNDALRNLYRRARALVFPGVEDFGMTMIEAQACGTPVIAFDAGGARETVRRGVTGLLYRDPSPAALADILSMFDPDSYSIPDMREHVARFDIKQFNASIRRIVDEVTHHSVSVAATDECAQRLQEDLDIEKR